MTTVTNEFDAAKAVLEALKPLQQPEQERVLRYVAEILGVVAPRTRADVERALEREPAGGSDGQAGEAPVDIRTFMGTKNPSSDVQAATAVAYFYRFVANEAERKESINTAVLTEGIRLAGTIKQPNAPAHTLRNAKNQGYLDGLGGGQYKINSVGENLVAMILGSNGGVKPGPKAGGARKKRGRHK